MFPKASTFSWLPVIPYHMFYYMIPLVTMLACFDSAKENNDSSSTIKENNTHFVVNEEEETKEHI